MMSADMSGARDELDQLGNARFQALAGLVEAACGIRLPATKRVMCEGRIRRRARALGCASLDSYVSLVLNTDQREQELPHVIDALTTNKTDFFREPAHFEALRDHLVPELIGLQKRRPALLKIWSAACSSGAEAYTAAMVLDELQRGRQDFRFSILGTDICSDVLEEAGAAIYSRAMAAPIPPDIRRRYVMETADHRRDKVRIVPELRSRVRFAHLNLIKPPFPVDNDIDVIFCRNVLIYFSRATQDAVVRELASHLRPGGFLLLGHSESMAGTNAERLDHVAPTVYRAR